MAIVTRRVSGKFPGWLHVADGPADLITHRISDVKADDNGSWFGGLTADEAFTKGVEGDSRYLPKVESLMAQVNATINVETQGYEIDNAVAGMLPDVPSAIMGLPEAMIMMTPTQADFAPITVWVNVSMSAGLSERLISQRGAAITVLLAKLQAIRPVMLKVVLGLQSNRGSQYVVVPVNTLPFSLEQISFILSNPGWARHAYWSVGGGEYGFGGAWDSLFNSFHNDARAKGLAEATLMYLGGDVEHDIYIPPLFLNDELVSDSVGWIEKTMARYATC